MTSSCPRLQLLGADDVDMKAAEIGSKDDKAEADAAPQTLKDVKK